MKKLFILVFLALPLVYSCKEDEPVTTNTDTDIRSNVIGEYNAHLTVFNAQTGALITEDDYYFKVQKNSKDASQVQWYLDGLYLFMNAQNFRNISVGIAFDVPEQELKDFGTLKGKNYINVDGDNQRYTGIWYTSSKSFTIYMEKDNGGSADDYLYEWKMTLK
ncbi:MAG: hypothetical protein H6608_00495 [Flavobacteriales bacterium]|nr:hypothetical protein [Bacteroidota bacterium]MCB9239584.1 hypothetical protein [Flavobacteriales bacterium]